MNPLGFIYKSSRFILLRILHLMHTLWTYFLLKAHSIQFESFKTNGVPFIVLSKGGKFVIGNKLKINNTVAGNPIGRSQRCSFFVGENATLTIGENVGMSQTAIVCHERIEIGNNIKIGGGVCIYDTDFHSLDPAKRRDPKADFADKKCKPVYIEDNVFIGAHSTILKGVRIGHNSIIGACSVVTKNIPANQIWGGNPACFIKPV
jgi:acetyltransferase-like isoleucine patch superfamily enzyme